MAPHSRYRRIIDRGGDVVVLGEREEEAAEGNVESETSPRGRVCLGSEAEAIPRLMREDTTRTESGRGRSEEEELLRMMLCLWL